MHIPVLFEESLQLLQIQKGETVVDCTLGGGGHTTAFLNAVGKEGNVIAIEANPDTAKETAEKLKSYTNLTIINENFEYLEEIITDQRQKNPAIQSIHHIFFDLGLSSFELADDTAGFSFQVDSPLNMRFDKKTQLEGFQTAEELVNKRSKEVLIEILKEYGEEDQARKIVGAITRARSEKPIKTTLELAAIIEEAVPRRGRIHPATKTFQALRIAVNKELDVLKSALGQSIRLLEPEGTLALISFHSLEDRIVKHMLKEASKMCQCHEDVLICQCDTIPSLEILTRKPILPTEEEQKTNPRARSAKLRGARKIDPETFL